MFFFVISGTFGSFWDIADHYNYMRFFEWMAGGSIIYKQLQVTAAKQFTQVKTAKWIICLAIDRQAVCMLL